MKKHLPIIGFLMLLVLMASCNKEDLLKNPAPISFSLEMDAESTSAINNITFDSATILLSSFTVIGDRAMAEDYEFTRTFPLGLLINLERPNAFNQLRFDLPQGQYEKITIRFEANNLYVKGRIVMNPQKTEAIIHFKLNEPKQFEIKVTDTLGNTRLNLQESVAENPRIIFKPKLWFEWIPETMFENATSVLSVGNQRIIYIGEHDNSLIFDIVNHYIVSSTQCFLHP